MFDEYWGITELQEQFMWLENKMKKWHMPPTFGFRCKFLIDHLFNRCGPRKKCNFSDAMVSLGVEVTVSINVSKLSSWGSTPFPGQPLTGAEGLFSIPLQGPSSPLFNFPSNYWNGLDHPLTCLDNVCKSRRASWYNFISNSDWDFCRLYFVLFIPTLPTYHIQSIPIKNLCIYSM